MFRFIVALEDGLALDDLRDFTRELMKRVTPAEVRTVLAEKLGNLLEFAEHVEATEYFQSPQYWPDRLGGARGAIRPC